MLKRTALSCAIASLLANPVASIAEVEVTGYLKNETAFHSEMGQYHGEGTTAFDRDDHHTEFYKFENSARLFMNGDLGDNASWHGDLNVIFDPQAHADYQGHDDYSQNDWIRELYVDMNMGSVDIRVGKQQVVWGTADGIKLLDIINPTDFREFSQNTMEDSRIPIMMVKADVPVGDTSDIQFIVAENEENRIPGLNENGDQGHPFILKGVDSITGKVNGFYNIVPALGGVAQTFSDFAAGGAFLGATSLVPFTGLTVDGFASNTLVDGQSVPGGIRFQGQAGFTAANATNGYRLLNNITQNGNSSVTNDPNANNNVTNLMAVTGTNVLTDVTWDPANPTSAFEYMPNSTFTTFNTFASAGSQYVRDYPDQLDPNFGVRYKNNLDSGLSFSLNYFYHYDANPAVNLSWHDATTGEELSVQRVTQLGTGMPDTTSNVGENDVPNTVTSNALTGNATNSVSVLARNSAGQYYGPFSPVTGAANTNTNGTVLRFTEKVNRIHSLGASFDYGFELGEIPTVVRGEFLYDQNVHLPIVDKRLLAIGDLSNALRTQETDMFKYVLGVDFTVATNLLISTQFIQFINMDYEDEERTCTTQLGIQFDCSKYTADPATLHLSNGLNKGQEYKEFVSLFFSKPFGSEQQGRWNNITIVEDEGGIWNRLDVEYGFTDSLIGTAEWNHYTGTENSTFGQMNNSSNVQVGIKYIFD